MHISKATTIHLALFVASSSVTHGLPTCPNPSPPAPGPPANCCYNEGASLGSALSSANDNDQVYICANTDIKMHSMTVNANNVQLMCDGSGCKIDGEGKSHILSTHGDSFTCQGVEFKNGKTGDNGGAIQLHGDGAHTLDNCKFKDNEADGDGGALYFGGNGSTVISNTKFENNKAKNKGGAGYFDKTITSKSNSFDGNKADDECDDLYVHGGTCVKNNSRRARRKLTTV